MLVVGNIGEVCRPLLHGDVMPVDGDGAIRRTHDAAAGDQLLHAVGAPARDTGGGKQRREHIRRDAQHGVYQTGVHIHVGAQRRVIVAAFLHQRDAQLLHLLQKGEVLGVALDLRQMLGVLLQQHGAGVGDGVYRVTEAVQLADENVGVVLNSSQSYVWERGNRQQGMRLDETTMPSGFQSASLDENVLKESLGDDYELLNLTGCTREEILYMISSGCGVVVKTGANESLLLTGYDIFGNSWLYNPATGETTALSDDDSDALFAQNGNVFISYIKKVKIE